MSISSYPRRGHRLAPQTLREVLDVPAPPEIAPGRAAGLRLCDLDESVWDHFEVEECEALAGAVVACAQRAMTKSGPLGIKSLRSRLLPRPPRGVEFEDLDLTVRTANRLLRARWQEKLLSGKPTVGEVLSLRNFGGASLVDLLTALECCPPPARSPSEVASLNRRLVEKAKALLSLPESRHVSRDDPRLGVFLRGVFAEEHTLYDVAVRIQSAKGKIRRDAAWVEAGLEAAMQKLRLCLGMSLEEELSDLVKAALLDGPETAERNRRLLLRLLGWDGQGGCTLQSASDTVGITRERVRQIRERAIASLKGRQIFAPTLDRALAFVGAQPWSGVEEVARGLAQGGYSKDPFHPAGLVRAAGILGREAPFEIRGKRDPYIVARGATSPSPSVVKKVRLMVGKARAIQVSEVLRRLPQRWRDALSEEQLVTILRASGDFVWLDQPEGWFLLKRPKSLHQWLRKVNKVLSLAGEMEVDALHACLLRCRSKLGAVPSPRAILALCAQVPGYRLEGNRIVADPPVDWKTVLTSKESVLVSIFQEQGPLLFTDTLNKLSRERGLGSVTLSLLLKAAPFVVRLAPGLYRLVGSGPSPLGPLPTGIGPGASLLGYDQSSPDHAWFVFRISEAMQRGGCASCECGVEKPFRGRYRVVTSDGTLCGDLRARGKGFVGLESFYRSTGAAEGGFLVLVLQPKRWVAVGGLLSLEEALAESFTCSPERLRALLRIAETVNANSVSWSANSETCKPPTA